MSLSDWVDFHNFKPTDYVRKHFEIRRCSQVKQR